MNHRIITISREFGSGGRTIGQELSRLLNIPCYDRELIELLADKSGFSEKHVLLQGSRHKVPCILDNTCVS